MTNVKPFIEIKIGGFTGTGKTSLAEFIQVALENYGFDVVVNDDNGTGITEETALSDHNHERLDNLIDKGLTINIQTVSLLRNAQGVLCKVLK